MLADGDPRGELIALDLAPQPDDADWHARRTAVLAKWLGSSLAARVKHMVNLGFIHELDDGKRNAGLTSALLASPAGATVRQFATRGQPTKVRATIHELAAKPRPVLTSLQVHVRGTSREFCVSDRAMAKLVDATPRLREVEVRGRRVLAEIAHPALRRLHLSNHDSVIDVVRANGDDSGFLRVTCEAATGQYAGSVPPDELRRALAAIDAAASYNDLYSTHAETFGELLPSLLARLEAAGLVLLTAGMPALTSTARAILDGSRQVPAIRRTLERPCVPITSNPYGNNVWLETKKEIRFIGHIHTLSSLACLWLERLPLTSRVRRIAEELLDALYSLRRTGRATAQDSVSGNLEMLLKQIAALEAGGIDPKRDGESSMWVTTGWRDVRDGAFRELLRSAGVRMTFAVR